MENRWFEDIEGTGNEAESVKINTHYDLDSSYGTG